MPSMLLDFRSSFDARPSAAGLVLQRLLMDRALLPADALRSFGLFILLGAAC